MRAPLGGLLAAMALLAGAAHASEADAEAGSKHWTVHAGHTATHHHEEQEAENHGSLSAPSGHHGPKAKTAEIIQGQKFDSQGKILTGPSTYYFTETFEADRVADLAFEYPHVYAADSHNGEVDVCERQYINVDGNLEMCCVEDDRAYAVAGCAQSPQGNHGSDDDPAPDMCGSNEDLYPCHGVETIAVGTYFARYTSMDNSENIAAAWYATYIFEDTIPPIISVPQDWEDDGFIKSVSSPCECEAFGFWDVIDTCAAWTEPECTAFDRVDLFTEVTKTYQYFSWGTENVIHGTNGDTQSLETGVYCEGGEIMEQFDDCMEGVWCITYDSVDLSDNVATNETIVIEISGFTPAPTPVPSAAPSAAPTPVPCEMEITTEDGKCEYELVAGWPLDKVVKTAAPSAGWLTRAEEAFADNMAEEQEHYEISQIKAEIQEFEDEHQEELDEEHAERKAEALSHEHMSFAAREKVSGQAASSAFALAPGTVSAGAVVALVVAVVALFAARSSGDDSRSTAEALMNAESYQQA